MTRAWPFALCALCACWNFGAARSGCEDAGACRFDGGAGGGGGGAAGGAGNIDGGPEFGIECSAGWCLELSFPGNADLDGVWTDGTTTWLVGQFGVIYSLEAGRYRSWPQDLGEQQLRAVVSEPGRITAAGRGLCEKSGAAPSFTCTSLGHDYHALWVAPDGGRVVVGDDPASTRPVLREDRGSGWVGVTVPGSGTARGVGGPSWDDLWVVGDNGLVLVHQPDGGWEQFNAVQRADAGPTGWTATCVDGAGTRWLTSATTSTLYTWDGGELTAASAAINQASYLTCKPDGGAYYGGFGQQEVADCSTPFDCRLAGVLGTQVLELASAPNGMAVVVGALGRHAVVDGGGLTSLRVSLPGDTALGLARSADGTLYLAGTNRTLMKHTADGWRAIPTAPTGTVYFNSLAFDDAGTLWVVGDNADVRKLQGSQLVGVTVTGVPQNVSFDSVASTSFGMVAVGTEGVIAFGGSQPWRGVRAADAGQAKLRAVHAWGDDALAVGAGSTVLLIRSDGGVSAFDAGVSGDFYSLLVLSRDELFIGASVGVWHLHQGTADSATVATSAVRGLAGTRGDVWAAATDGSLWRFDGSGWTVEHMVSGTYFAVEVTAGTVHVAGAVGGELRVEGRVR